jgi:hypothetical protein
MNRSNYKACVACKEPPLGSLDEVEEEVQGEFELYVPGGEEKLYCDVLKGVMVVGSALFYASSEGFALQKFYVAEEKWPTFNRYEFWEYCVFSDFMEKEKVTEIADPFTIPPYPNLFPIAAFYANNMANVHLEPKTAHKFLQSLPFDAHIKETLEQLSFHMYQMLGGSSGSDSPSMQMPQKKNSRPGGGIRLLTRDKSVREQVAAQMSKAAGLTYQRPDPPTSDPRKSSTNF